MFCKLTIAYRKSWLRHGLLLALVGVLTLAAVDKAKGAKPGGGTTPPPPGTIYFRHAGAMWKMDGAGTPSSRVPLIAAPSYGDPSYSRPGNQRWFVYADAAGPPDELPRFPNDRVALDIRAGSEAGNDLLLLAAHDIELISEPIWAADDGSCTFIGERWELDDDGIPIDVVEAGLYELNIDFSSSVPTVGALNLIADLSGPMQMGPNGFDTEGIISHSWRSDGMKCVFSVTAATERIWIVDLASITDPGDVPAEAFQLIASGNVSSPKWSPDGSRIGYFSMDGTVVYELASGRKKILRRTTTGHWGPTIWSPAGAYFVAYHWDNFLPGYDSIFRFTADIGGKTELTAGLTDPLPSLNAYVPVGWRN